LSGSDFPVEGGCCFAGWVGGARGVLPLPWPLPVSTMMRARFQASLNRRPVSVPLNWSPRSSRSHRTKPGAARRAGNTNRSARQWPDLSWDTVATVVQRRLENDYRKIGCRHLRHTATDELHLGRTRK
jgi:hypothetical protein